MSFDIPNLHIPDDSVAARVIEAIVADEHVTPAEALQRALERFEASEPVVGLRHRKGSRLPLHSEDPEAVIGMFSGQPEIGAAIDAVIGSRGARYACSTWDDAAYY